MYVEMDKGSRSFLDSGRGPADQPDDGVGPPGDAALPFSVGLWALKILKQQDSGALRSQELPIVWFHYDSIFLMQLWLKSTSNMRSS